MAHRSYGALHQQRRAELLAYVAIHPGELKCPYCDKGLTSDMTLDLSHSSPELKRQGRPGDRLACSSCNRGELSVPPQVRAKAAQSATVDRRPECKHRADLDRVRVIDGCQCGDPVRHHAELARAARSAGEAVTVGHHPPCPSCGGYSGSRIW